MAINIVLQAVGCLGQSSVLQSGTWYKMAVDTRGVFKITYDQFKKMGFDPASSDPRKIRIFGNSGGMLPQANNLSRPADLEETAIFVSGQADESFDKEDFIIFFAEGPDKVDYDIDRHIFSYESNLYSKKNFYYITVSEDNGKRVEAVDNLDGNFPSLNTYEDYVYHEADEYNDQASGREWFGERYDLVTTYAYNFDVDGIVANSPVKLVSDVMAQSFNGSSFKLAVNRIAVGEQAVPVISNTQYSVKGRHKRDTITFNASAVGAPDNTKQEVLYEYVKSPAGKNIGFLDFLLLTFDRTLSLYNDQSIFRSTASLEQPISTYNIRNVSEGSMIWDITNKAKIKSQSYQPNGEAVSFSTPSDDQLKEFIVFNTKIPAPEFIGAVPNQNLHGMSPVNLIIISHPQFLEEASRLAAHRIGHNQWSAAVVTPESIYNEFSSGRQDVSAIRDFVRSIYIKDPGQL
ncbi:MAG TPA: C25 family cysteine peptidase, partial [Chryseolinea sp.]|nr:C25 family cysteine peptidase [Chryseolinea sp.]